MRRLRRDGVSERLGQLSSRHVSGWEQSLPELHGTTARIDDGWAKDGLHPHPSFVRTLIGSIRPLGMRAPRGPLDEDSIWAHAAPYPARHVRS